MAFLFDLRARDICSYKEPLSGLLTRLHELKAALFKFFKTERFAFLFTKP